MEIVTFSLAYFFHPPFDELLRTRIKSYFSMLCSLFANFDCPLRQLTGKNDSFASNSNYTYMVDLTLHFTIG